MTHDLGWYITKRLGFAGIMLVGVSMILFTIMRLAPGGPEAVLVGGEFSQEAAEQVRKRLGLDRPLPLQYVTQQEYQGFVPIPAYGGIYQSLRQVRWTGK